MTVPAQVSQGFAGTLGRLTEGKSLAARCCLFNPTNVPSFFCCASCSLHVLPLCLQGRALPRAVPTGDGSDGGAGGGVWVVGLSKESEADRAGIQQGDQLLQVWMMVADDGWTWLALVATKSSTCGTAPA